MNMNLLIVDDDSIVADTIELILPDGWNLYKASSPSEIPTGILFQAAFLDMHLTGNLEKAEGLELIPKVIQKNSFVEIVAMSGNLDRELMENCLKAGANRFLAKPLSQEEVILTLDKIEALHLIRSFNPNRVSDSLNWIGESGPSQIAKLQIANFTGETGPILIEGETGTGKEVTANMIHNNEKKGPFIPVNIAAIPENLFESEFFGHVRGAFTGAHQNKIGLAEAAHGGDLFIDEIEALALNQQVKLLRFLESGEIRRVGASTPIKINVRVIVATNKNLDNMVQEGSFREDLLWRINHQKITLPPLRERLDDIEKLAEFFIAKDKVRKKTFTPESLKILKMHSWPGNIRELKRMCEHLVLNTPLPFIRPEDVKKLLPEMPVNFDSETLPENQSLSKTLSQLEAKILQKYLCDLDFDLQKVGDTLKVSRSNLYKKIKDYNLNLN